MIGSHPLATSPSPTAIRESRAFFFSRKIEIVRLIRPPTKAMITICALFYGDHGEYARRCLGGLANNLKEGRPFTLDIRLGLNVVSPGVSDYILKWAEDVAGRYQLPILVYSPKRNALKYPLMRRMFHTPVEGHPLGEHVMWFDDDAYLEPGFQWRRMLECAADKDMIGHMYHWFIQDGQFEWVKKQWWYNPDVGDPLLAGGRPCFLFVQGSWWVIRSEILREYDWPIPQLRHNGGDSMLGELCRQQRLRLAHYEERVKVNADIEGRNSAATRRGYHEPPLGSDPAEAETRNLSFQNFQLSLRVRTSHGWSETQLSE